MNQKTMCAFDLFISRCCSGAHWGNIISGPEISTHACTLIPASLSGASGWGFVCESFNSSSPSLPSQIESAKLASPYFVTNWLRVSQRREPKLELDLRLVIFKYSADFRHSPWHSLQASIKIWSLSWPRFSHINTMIGGSVQLHTLYHVHVCLFFCVVAHIAIS